MFHLAKLRGAAGRASFVFVSLILTFSLASAEAPRVENGTTPADGVVTVSLQEMWRAGGEDDDVFFGNVGRVTTDPAGNVVILDGQLSEAHVYDADGEHLTTVGKEGDGPGEVRRPGDIFVTSDGTFCLLQTFPGKVVKLMPDGLPGGEANFSTGQAAQGQFAVLFRGLPHPRGMVLAGNQMSFGGGSQSTQNYFLAICDAAGAQLAPLVAKSYLIDYADFSLVEADLDFIYNRITTDRAGRVFVALPRNSYEIQVFDSDGTLEREFGRDYEPLVRDQLRRDLNHRILEGIGAYYPVTPREYVIEDTDPDISGMWAMDNGELWVQTSRGDAEAPSGAWTMLDVFDADGVFTRQLALPGGHDPLKDALNVIPDGRVVVVKGALEAFLNQMAVSSEEDAGADEATPLEVICYTMTN